MMEFVSGRSARHPVMGDTITNAMTLMPTAINTRISQVTTAFGLSRRTWRVRGLSVVSFAPTAGETPGGDHD
jgi:hypothetical protein